MAEQDKDLFQKIGIDIGNDKINIDINQTKNFFNTLKQTFEDTAQNIQKDISEGKVDMAENVGIKVDKENINIDLAKTQSFIEEFGKKIEGFLGEIDKAVDNIDKK
ncbi:hypothetical protein [Sulfurovum sp.]|uniref:hypothetical protein n=1 Tax=Sulfurovum sp. TaxID=1969726 RepID=UPI0028681E64|nr:hypothetical protein [Sulfurovum sp.]